MPRLNEIIREVNVGFTTIKQFLSNRLGIKVSSVNDLITDEQYEFVARYLGHDRILQRVLKKRYDSRVTSRNPYPESPVYTDEEKSVLEYINNFETKYERAFVKEKNKKKRKRKGKTSKPSRNDESKKVKYIRFISVPFGGMNKR